MSVARIQTSALIFFPFLTLNLFLVIMSLSLSFLPFPLPSFSHSHDRALGAFARREAFLTYLLANQHKQPAVVSRIRSILSSPMPIVSKSVPAPEAGEDEVFTAQMHRFCEFMLRGQAEPVAGYPQLSAFAPGWNLKKDAQQWTNSRTPTRTRVCLDALLATHSHTTHLCLRLFACSHFVLVYSASDHQT